MGPKWRRAGCSVLRNGEEDVEDRPRTSINGGELVRSTFVVLTFARALAFVASFILVFVFCLSFLLWERNLCLFVLQR